MFIQRTACSASLPGSRAITELDRSPGPSDVPRRRQKRAESERASGGIGFRLARVNWVFGKGSYRSRWVAGGAALVTLLAVAHLSAQRFGQDRFNRNFANARKATPRDFDGTFQFCRLAFGRDPGGDGGGWSVDYPRADINLSVRLAELTKTRVGRDGEVPHHLLVEADDPELFGCPFLMMTNVGAASITEAGAAHLRSYLQKGGFIWADDFWGSRAWDWWEGQLRKILPAHSYPIIDLAPDHPLYHTQFAVKRTPQIANIGFWSRSGGGTSERGADSDVVHTRAAVDAQGHILVLMTHNTDLGDSFEREGDDPTYFSVMSVPGYSFGINALLYAMTH